MCEAVTSLLLLHLVVGLVTGQECSEGDVRLAGGPSESEGRVEICVDGEWGTACDDYWDMAAARVVCRQLGLDFYSVPFTFGGGCGEIHVFSCAGQETSLQNCAEVDIFCAHFKDAGVKCYNASECNENDVRLVDGQTPQDGRVEICLEGVWGSVCDDNWDSSDAEVVCRQLGYNGSSFPLLSHHVLSQTELFYHLDEVACNGNENRLSDCAHGGIGSHNCVVKIEKAGVICSTNVQCNDTDVRLVDGLTPQDGRVEICVGGFWGSVCDDEWDSSDAEVVCRQLGYEGLSFPITSHPVLSNASLFYYLDDVNCSGNERLLSECVHDGVGVHNCFRRAEEAGVICNFTCNETDVRLVDGATPRDGRVEICLNGVWGSVCDDLWGERDAEVVCRQLGYEGSSLPLSNHPVLLHSSRLYHLDNVNCDGSESRLSDCDHLGVGVHDCGLRLEEAGVICSNTCNEDEVRLVGGVTPDDGRVEMCANGVWGTVCDDRWDQRDADVVCRQLDFDGPSFPLLRHSSRNPPPLRFEDISCNGSETMLSQCGEGGDRTCYGGEAGAICTNRTCREGTLHLVGGDAASRGRVLYCYNGTWHSVCADGWSTSGQETRAVCQSLGYDTSQFVSVLVEYGQGTTPILQCASGALTHCSTAPTQCSQVAGVNCQAPCTTEGLNLCSHCSSPLLFACGCNTNCFSSGDCCSDISFIEGCFERECQHGEVRLVGGVTNSTGRLEFCAHGVWGRVCDALGYWGTDNARVVCHQLGFSGEGAFIFDSQPERFGTSARDAVIGQVHCVGTEPDLLECSHASIGSHFCSASDPDIFISCYDEERGCENGDVVRLIAGVGDSDGYVEACLDRTWVGICRNGFQLKDARVICDMLTFDPQDALLIEGPAVTENGPVPLSQVSCEGSERYFNECSHARPPNGDCSQAAISCGKSSNQPRCPLPAGNSSPTTDSDSYGQCSVYTARTEACEGVIRLGIDHVYARSRLGNQSTIAQMLDENLKSVEGIVGDGDRGCLKIVYRALCHFYLPSCGNATHPAPPTSICPMECRTVQEKCDKSWNAVLLALNNDVTPVINCDDTSSLLFPLPHCCTGAGLDAAVRALDPQPMEDTGEGGRVTGAVVGVVVFILLAVLAVVCVIALLVLSSKIHRRKQLERMQLDILALPGHNAPALITVVAETNMAATNNWDMELHEKTAPVTGAGITGPNPYSKPISSRPATESASSLQVAANRARVPSYHMRELARGKLLVKSEDIILLECIGEGEFGIVYKARLGLSKREVAVKTLKGDFDRVEVDKFVEESLKMSRFKHAHVMGLISVCLDAGSAPYIIMPYMANGSLLKWLKKERKNIVLPEDADEDEVREVSKRLMAMCSQIASGMEYLAEDKYIHRDLATRNCMIDTHFLIKITDFGLSEDVFERSYFRQGSVSGEVVRLPIKWMAPESLSDGHFSEKSDVWSYGVTMWEIFSGGKAPYPGTDPLTLMQTLEKGRRMPQPYNAACSKEIYGIMRQCWHMEPGDRPTFKELCSTVSKCIERVAGYLQFGFNPFTGGGGEGEGGGGKGGEVEEGERVGSVEIQVFPPSAPADTILTNNTTD